MGKSNQTQRGQSGTAAPEDHEADHGTKELRSHHTILKTSQRSYVLSQMPLDYYYFSKKCLSEREYRAGVRLYECYARAGIEGKITSAYNIMGALSGSKQKDVLSEGNWKARQELRRALAASGGSVAHFLLVNVVCHCEFLKDLMIYGYATPASKMDRFREALQEVANFYGIPLDD